MNTNLTIEQSAELIKRGVDAYKASIIKANRDPVSQLTNRGKPVFTLYDLLSLVPKELYGEETDYCHCELHLQATKLGWRASYIEFRGSEIMIMKFTSYGVELIDTLFSLSCKLLDNHIELN